MRSDGMCTSNSEHRVAIFVSWCGDCVRWHFRLSLQQRSAPSSRQWQTIDASEWDHTPEMDEFGWRMGREIEAAVRDLQRLYAEADAGIRRLF